MEDEQRTVISTVCHLWYSTPWKMSSGLSSAQSVIFGTVPHGRWATDCHWHSLSSLVQYPMEDEQRTVISTVCHLRYSTPWKMSSGLSSAQSVIFGTVPHGKWAADCHKHSLSSSVQYPMEDEQRTVISTVCHLWYSTPWKMSSGLSSAQSVIFGTLHHTGDLKTKFIYTSAWMTFVTLGQRRWCAIMSYSNYLGRLPLVQQGYC